MFALFANVNGEDATADDCAAYAEYIGDPDYPVFADPGAATITAATPLTADVHPELCVIGPDMVLLECYSGHGKIDSGLDLVRDHAGLK